MAQVLFFSLFLLLLQLPVFLFYSCSMPSDDNEKISSDSDNLLSAPVQFYNWSEENQRYDWANYNFSSSSFSFIEEGDEIEIKIRTMTDSEFKGTNGGKYSMFTLYYSSWKERYKFSNIQSEPSLDKYKKDDTGENECIFNRKNRNYTILITLTKEEAAELARNGLIFNGYGFFLDSVKVSQHKLSYIDADGLENQYQANKEAREKVINYYKDYIGFSIPYVYITSENHEEILEKSYYNSIIDVVNCDSSYQVSTAGGVKVRGNSTAWHESEKPYRIKFDKKQNLLGLHDGKKYKSWVLLKTKWCFGADYLGFNLAHEIYKSSDFDYYASDCTYVHVFVNEAYKGLYLLCEQSQVNEGRVDVFENKEGNTSTKVGYMIELDNYAWEDSGNADWFENGSWYGRDSGDYHFQLDYKYSDPSPEDPAPAADIYKNDGNDKNKIYLTDVNGVRRLVRDTDAFTLKNDVYSREQVNFIRKYMKGIWDICYSAIELGDFYVFDSDYNLKRAAEGLTAEDVCSSVIDLESLANEMILEELVRDNDVGAGSLYMAVDFTVGEGQKYSKFTFECPWDFNWAYSNYDEDSQYFAGGRLEYFAGAWQPLYVNTDGYERSHPWFILFNNADWFRKYLRQKWQEIGAENLKSCIAAAEEAASIADSENSYGSLKTYADFVRDRIDYIDSNLWLK